MKNCCEGLFFCNKTHKIMCWYKADIASLKELTLSSCVLCFLYDNVKMVSLQYQILTAKACHKNAVSQISTTSGIFLARALAAAMCIFTKTMLSICITAPTLSRVLKACITEPC